MRFPSTTANLLVVGERPNHVMSGWVAADSTLAELWAYLISEIEFTFEITVTKPEDYYLYVVDVNEDNHLVELLDQDSYDFYQGNPPLYLVVLHKTRSPIEIELDPEFAAWLDDVPPQSLDE